MLRHGYGTALRAELEDHPLLLAERSYTPPPIRQHVLECVMEECKVPAVFMAKDAVLACYGCGRTTATVVDLGYSGTTVTPVFDGFAESNGIQRSPVGLGAVDQYILQQLEGLYTQHQHHGASGSIITTATGTGSVIGTERRYESIMPVYRLRPPRSYETATAVTLPRPLRRRDIHEAALLDIAVECRELGAGVAINLATDASGVSTIPGKAAGVGGSASGGVASGAGGGGSSNGVGPSNAGGTKVPSTFQAPHKPFTLPDGTVLQVPSTIRFSAAELLLGDTPLRKEYCETAKQGIMEMCAAIQQSDMDEDDEDEGGGGSGMNGGSTSGDDPYSKANQVGLLKRRTKSNRSQSKRLSQFSNKSLRRACLPYLQMLEEKKFTAASVASMVCTAAYSCDREQQAALLGTVVVSGEGRVSDQPIRRCPIAYANALKPPFINTLRLGVFESCVQMTSGNDPYSLGWVEAYWQV